MTVEIGKLSNGMTWLIDPIRHTEAATVGIYVNAGSLNENKNNNGVAHFLEHMAFKGTKTRDARQLAVEMAGLGAKPNAYTSHTKTAYHTIGLASAIGPMIELEADVICNSILPQHEVERERGVIIQEIGGYKDDPSAVVGDNAMMTAFPGQPMGASILGPKDLIAGMKRESLQQFMKAHYHAGNMLAVVAGNVDVRDTVDTLERALGGLKGKAPSTVRKPVYKGGSIHEERPVSQIKLELLFNAVATDHAMARPITVMSHILGGGMDSRLFEEIREKRGMVYTVASFQHTTKHGGIMGVYAGTGEEHVASLMPVLADELKRMAHEKVSDAELQRAKNQILTSIALSADSVGGRRESAASSYLLRGRVSDLEEIKQAFNRISVDDVQAAAQLVFSSKPTLSTLGPGANIEPYGKFRARLKM